MDVEKFWGIFFKEFHDERIYVAFLYVHVKILYPQKIVAPKNLDTQ